MKTRRPNRLLLAIAGAALCLLPACTVYSSGRHYSVGFSVPTFAVGVPCGPVYRAPAYYCPPPVYYYPPCY